MAVFFKVVLEKGYGNEVVGGCFLRVRLKVFINGLDVRYERENLYFMFRGLI